MSDIERLTKERDFARNSLTQKLRQYDADMLTMRDALNKEIVEASRLRAEIERLLAALKPFADEVDMLGLHGNPPPPERMLMFASDGDGTYLGIEVKTLYDAAAAYQQSAQQEKP